MDNTGSAGWSIDRLAVGFSDQLILVKGLIYIHSSLTVVQRFEK